MSNNPTDASRPDLEQKLPPEPDAQIEPAVPADLSDIVQRIEDLVRLTKECETKELRDDISFVDIYQQLLLIKQGVELLNQGNEQLVQDLRAQGMIPPDIELSEKDKKLIARLDKIKKECEDSKERLYQSLQENQGSSQNLSEQLKDAQATPQQKARRRKGKFKGLGSKDGWTPA